MTADLIVVGAGIVGTTVAEEARRRAPTAKILLLDGARPGSGSTRHSAALSTPTAATDGHRQLVTQAQRWYGRLARERELQRRQLAAYWVVRETRLDQLREEFVRDPPAPAGAAALAHLRSRHPDLVVQPDEVVLCSHGVWVGAAEATAMMLAARLNRTSSAACWEGTRVDDVQPHDSGGQLVFTHIGQRLRSRHVVLATGPWLADDPGCKRAGWKLRVKKVAALHLARRPDACDPAVFFYEEDAFLLPLPERGLTLFSFFCPTWDVRPGEDLVIERGEMDTARAVLGARSPALAAAVTGGRASCDGYLPDRLPTVTEDPARPGVLLLGGCSGSGFRLAPALAELALAKLDRFATN